MLNYNIEFHHKVNDSYIDYGIIPGNNKILFIKPGLNGSMYGYKDKYLNIAKDINKKYGCTIISSSNKGDDNLDDAIEVINNFVKESNYSDYEIYYFGYSNGAYLGLVYGEIISKIKRMLLINGPLMYNFHKIKSGVQKFGGDRLSLVYGEKDQSIKYTELLKPLLNDKVKLDIIKDESHEIENSNLLLELIEKNLFYDEI